MPKKTLARIEEGLTATSAAYSCAALIDAGLEEHLGGTSTAEDGLDCGGRLAVRIAQRMEVLRQQLEVASETLERIGDELRLWRQKRDAANDRLYDAAKALRQFCRGAWEGGEGDRFLGLRGSLPREPKELHAAFGPVVRRLADAEWSIPEATVAGIAIDRGRMVATLSDAHRELGQALAAVKTGETQETIAKAAWQRAAAAHNTFLDKSCRFLESALELAGLDDLAATVRPGLSRPGRRAKKKLTGTEAPPAAAAALNDGGSELLTAADTAADDRDDNATEGAP
ncbi:MAG: hypothetical protein AAF657_21450 [Acidobacteriota bacterium]